MAGTRTKPDQWVNSRRLYQMSLTNRIKNKKCYTHGYLHNYTATPALTYTKCPRTCLRGNYKDKSKEGIKEEKRKERKRKFREKKKKRIEKEDKEKERKFRGKRKEGKKRRRKKDSERKKEMEKI